MDTKPMISDELLHQIEDTARAQHRQPSEVLEEAVRQYLDRSWTKILAFGHGRAKELNLTGATSTAPLLKPETNSAGGDQRHAG